MGFGQTLKAPGFPSPEARGMLPRIFHERAP